MKKFKLVHLASLNGRFAFPSKTRNLIFLATLHLALCTIVSAQWLETTIKVDSLPCALIYNSTYNKVYCANSYCDNVTIIEGATDSVVTNVMVDDYPSALIYNPTNNKIYCANYLSNNVAIIDGATNSVIRTIEVGDRPRAFTYNPQQNRDYVPNYYSSTVSVIRDSIIPGIEETTNPNAINLIPEIYPNPARSVLRVRGPLASFTSKATRSTLKIFDVSGQLIKEIASPPKAARNDEVKVSLKGINPGIYFLQLGTITKKFIVTR